MGNSAEVRLRNPVKQRFETGDIAIGMVCRISRSGDIARIARASGQDFVFIDLQHGIYSLETIGHIAQTALGCGVAPIARVRSCRDPDTALLLDCGVTGIMFPDINNAEEARIAVEAAKFPPIGKRSVTSGYAIFDYEAVPAPVAVEVMNANTLLLCMIETPDGLDNVEEIAAVEGVDVLFIGLTDLLYGLGRPGEFDDPIVMNAVERVVRAARQYGKSVGLGGDSDQTRQASYLSAGVNLFALPSDVALLKSAASSRVDRLRTLQGDNAR